MRAVYQKLVGVGNVVYIWAYVRIIKDKKDEDKLLFGPMVNISAGWFTFMCRASELVDVIGEKVTVTIEGFEQLEGEALHGRIIRSSDNDCVLCVGCRMHDDHAGIEEYVRKRMEE